jgi:Protein of unknown function (DUF2975)
MKVRNRSDWLKPLQRLLTVALWLAGLSLVLRVPAVYARYVVVDVPTRPVIFGPADRLPLGVSIAPGGLITVQVRDPTPAQLVLHELTTLPALLVIVTMTILLRRLVRDARRVDPFTMTTVRRLRVLAVVVLLGGGLAEVGQYAANLALASQASPGAISPIGSGFLHLSGWWLLVGFGFLAVGEVVNRGQAMRAELAEVI